MKKITCILLSLPFFFANQKSNAQKLQFHNDIPSQKNEVGIEVGGNSILYSVYYQRALFRKNNVQFNIRIGGTIFTNPYQDHYTPGTEMNIGAYILPNVLIFHKKHAWEFGVGLNMLGYFSKSTYYDYTSNTYREKSDNFQSYLVTQQLGYRLYFKNSRFYFRAAISTFIFVGAHSSNGRSTDVEPKWLPWGAAGFGYSF